jgi:hypothetical protein
MDAYTTHWHTALSYKRFVENYAPVAEVNCVNAVEVNTVDTDKSVDPADSAFLVFVRKLNIGNYDTNENQTYTLLSFVLCIVIVIDIQNEISEGRYPGGDYYKRRLREIVSCGGEATTHGAVLGSIIGLFVGFKNLPEEWIKKISNLKWLTLKTDKFCQKMKAH